MSSNVKVYGSFHFAESCTFDPDRNLILAMNAANPRDMGSPPPLTPNDGFVSLINPDGSVHTSKWIGVTRDGLTLVHPLGSAIQGGTLYVNDGNFIRTFDLKTGTPKQAFEVKEAVNLNGIGVAPDGTMYASNTGSATVPENKQRIYKVTPSGESSVFVDGAPLDLPNGVAVDTDGNVVVVNIGIKDVITFSQAGQVVRTEQAAEAGNDGVVVLRRRHEVRQQRSLRQRFEDPPRPAGRGHRDRHPERGLDVLRLEAEPARDSAESEQRAGVHSARPALANVTVHRAAAAGGRGPSLRALGGRTTHELRSRLSREPSRPLRRRRRRS